MLDLEQADMMFYQTQDFVTRSEVQRIIAPEMRKSTFHCKDPVSSGLVRDMLIEALQVGNDTTKDVEKTGLINLVGIVIVDTVQQRKISSLLVRSNEVLTQSDRFTNAMTRRVAGC